LAKFDGKTAKGFCTMKCPLSLSWPPWAAYHKWDHFSICVPSPKWARQVRLAFLWGNIANGLGHTPKRIHRLLIGTALQPCFG